MLAELGELPSLIDLDDPEALKPEVVGAKAARLAAARRAGLPVLSGIVLPVQASRGPLRRAVAIATESGTAAARLALSSETLSQDLELASRSVFGSDSIVARSSSPLESDGRWSGAFTSYVDIAAGEVATAVRGCWASMFARDANDRFEALGFVQADAGMAVLVQRFVDPEPGGVAAVDGRCVEVTIAERSLPGLLLGWERGLRGVVVDGEPPSGPAVEKFGPGLVAEVGRVALACADAIGDDHLEWAFVGGEVLILQCRRLDVSMKHHVTAPRGGDAALRSDVAARTGRLVSRYGGPAGDALVLSWALAPGESGTRHAPGPSVAPPARLESVQATARRIAAVAWRVDGPEAIAESEAVLAALMTRLDRDALARIARLEPIDRADGARLIDGVEALGSRLVATGVLADPSDVWRLSLSELARHIAGEPDEKRVGRRPVAPDPWEPFLLEATWANGTWSTGLPASDGKGAGRVLYLDKPRRLTGSLQRYILYVPAPQPGYAPLLWGAAGLVAAGGSAGAHLFDVARSLGVPAVAACERPEWEEPGDMVAAVDGSSGDVAWM